MAIYRVQAPDGRVLRIEGPEGASQDQIFSAAQSLYSSLQESPNDNERRMQDILQASQQAGQLRPTEDIKARAMELAQGPLLGFAEEIGSAIRASPALLDKNVDFQQEYESFLNPTRARQEAFREESPVEATLTNIAGSLPAGATAGAGLAASAATPLLRRIAASTGLSGLTGAATGFGEGEGNLANRLQSGMAGGVFGLGLGAAGQAIPVGIRALSRAIESPQTTAMRQADQILAREGVTPQIAAQQMKDLGSESVLADVSGEGARTLGAIRRARPDLDEKIRSVFKARQAGEQKRVAQNISEFVSSDDFDETLPAIISRRSESAAPLYNQARNVSLDQNSDAYKNLQNIFNEPEVKKILQDEVRLARIAGDSVPDSALTGEVTTESVDFVKKALDNKISVSTQDFKITPEGRAFLKLKNRMLQNIDELNPQYKKARDTFAGEAALEDALRKGRGFQLMDKAEIKDYLSAASDSQKDMFLTGVAKALDEKAASNISEARALTKNRAIREKVAEAIGNKEKAEQFLNNLDIEGEFRSTQQAVLGGSPTSMFEQDRGLASPSGLVGGLAGAIRSPQQAAAGVLEQIFPASPRVQESLAQILSSGASGLSGIARSRAAQDLFNRGVSGLGGLMGLSGVPAILGPSGQ